MAKSAASRTPAADSVSIVGFGENDFGWRVTGEDGRPLKPRFGKVIVHGASDAAKLRVSAEAMQRALKAIAESGKGGKLRSRRGHYPLQLHGVHDVVSRTVKSKRGAASRGDPGLAKEFD